MEWYDYIAYFFAGVFLCNGVPHFVKGVTGERFQSPFASPPGVGQSSAVVNVICTVICIFLAPHLALIAKTPGRILVPIVFVVIFAGTYGYKGYFGDLVILLIFSAVGFLARKFGYNPAGMFLGYILGKLFENYLFVSLQLGGALFFLRPICLFLIISLIVFFAWGPVKKKLKNRAMKEDHP